MDYLAIKDGKSLDGKVYGAGVSITNFFSCAISYKYNFPAENQFKKGSNEFFK